MKVGSCPAPIFNPRSPTELSHPLSVEKTPREVLIQWHQPKYTYFIDLTFDEARKLRDALMDTDLRDEVERRT